MPHSPSTYVVVCVYIYWLKSFYLHTLSKAQLAWLEERKRFPCLLLFSSGAKGVVEPLKFHNFVKEKREEQNSPSKSKTKFIKIYYSSVFCSLSPRRRQIFSVFSAPFTKKALMLLLGIWKRKKKCWASFSRF